MKALNASHKIAEPSDGLRRSEIAAEKGLIEQCQDGVGAAFEELVLKHQQRVFAVVFGMLGNEDEAKDVAQDAFIQAYRAIRTFRGESKFSTWLVGIAINLARHRRRWWARRKQHIGPSLDEVEESQKENILHQVAEKLPTPATEAMNQELKKTLIGAIRKLDEPGRTMVVLRDMNGLSYEEIAGMMRCRIGTVKSRLNRARLRLKADLEGKLE